MEDQKQPIRSSDDLSLFCCQNRKCPSFGMRGLGNLKVRGRVGRRKARQLFCTTCKQRFVETKSMCRKATECARPDAWNTSRRTR